VCTCVCVRVCVCVCVYMCVCCMCARTYNITHLFFGGTGHGRTGDDGGSKELGQRGEDKCEGEADASHSATDSSVTEAAFFLNMWSM
jgi:hypothetical protein